MANVARIFSADKRALALIAELLRQASDQMCLETFASETQMDVAATLFDTLAPVEVLRLSRREPGAVYSMGERCFAAASEMWLWAVTCCAFYEAGRGADFSAIKVMARSALADIHARREPQDRYPPPEFIAQTIAAQYAAHVVLGKA